MTSKQRDRQQRQCWQRAAGVDANHVSGFYTCGSLNCLKIADPQGEVESKTWLANYWLLIACVELLVGSVGFSIAFYFKRRLKPLSHA